MLSLKIHPELWACLERTSEQPRSLCGDATLPVDEFIDALNGYSKVFGEFGLSELHGSKKLLEEDHPGVGWDSFFGNHDLLRDKDSQRFIGSVIVDNFYIARAGIRPSENDPPLRVDPDAVETREVSFECL